MLSEFWKAVRDTETWRLVVSLEVGRCPGFQRDGWPAMAGASLIYRNRFELSPSIVASPQGRTIGRNRDTKRFGSGESRNDFRISPAVPRSKATRTPDHC